MSVRRTALATTVLALSLVLAAASGAGPRDRTAPTTPTNLRITASGPDSISLAWNASTDNSSNWWYIVQGCGGTIRVDPPRTTFTNKLGPGRTYTCSVYAVDAAGNRSGTSNVVTHATPPDTTPPTAPTISANGVWPTRVAVSWTQSKDNASQVWYTLLVDGSPYGADLIGYRGVTVIDLAPAAEHTFKVTVRDNVGNSAESNTLTVSTPAVTDTVAPSAPTDLRLSSESSPPEAWLDWTQSTDDTDPQSQILYRVFVNGELAGESTTIGYGSTITYCRTEGVNRIVLRAVDTSGNVSAPSNEILFNC
jgi:Fibronectin type III domain